MTDREHDGGFICILELKNAEGCWLNRRYCSTSHLKVLHIQLYQYAILDSDDK